LKKTFRLQGKATGPESRRTDKRLATSQRANSGCCKKTVVGFPARRFTNAEKLLEAGIINFAATLAAQPEAVEQMKAALAAKKSLDASKLRPAALPLKSSEVAIYTPSWPREKRGASFSRTRRKELASLRSLLTKRWHFR
jgi:hypothetical protein